MTIRKIAAGLQAMAIFALLQPTIPVFAETPETGVYTSINSSLSLNYEKYDDHIKIVSAKVNNSSLRIPEEIEGLPVTEMADGVFKNQYPTAVFWPETLTEIPADTFNGNCRLNVIVLPETLESIGNDAFDGCVRLWNEEYGGIEYPDFEHGLQDVLYKGTSAEWDQVMIGTGNDCLKKANKHCEYYASLKPTEFKFGEDNWSFTNGEVGQYLLTDETVDRYMEGFSEWERMELRETGAHQSGRTYNGACAGMAVTSWLVANNMLKPSDIYEGAETLHDIPLCQEAIEAITFYWIHGNYRSSYKRIEDQFAFIESSQIPCLMSFFVYGAGGGSHMVLLSVLSTGHGCMMM